MDFTFHPGVNGSDPWVEFYPYYPSREAGYAFVALFGLSTVAHFVLMIPYKAAYFIPMVLGGICETFGYYGRAWSHESRTKVGPWALQEMLIMCAPPLIAATIYMFLGRVVRSFDAEHHASIRPKWLTPIFVLNDIITFITQIAGAGVQVTGDAHLMDIGKKATLAGLIFSLIVFCLFVLIAAVFHRRCNRDPTPVLLHNPNLNWKQYMWALYISCFMIMLRNLIRLIQFGSGKESPLNTKEAFIYVFDAVPMFISVVVLVVYHPGLLIKRARNAQKGEMLMADRNSGDVPLTQYAGARV